ncbi:MAG: hypothetical protein OQK45_06845, partial [Sulfurovum sp.]|nr:hypothetical protein [Sulfurovum sp.]
MQSEDLLIKAKSQLTIKHPYFGMLASRLKHESSAKINAYASNGKRFLYNPEFMARRNIDEIMFILTNCVMHHVLSHQQRRLDRRGSLWQLSTDYAINNLLHQNGVSIPQGANFNDEYKGMYAEEIYDALKKAHFADIPDAFDNDNVLPNQNLAAEALSNSEDNKDIDVFSNIENIDEEIDPETESQWNYAESVSQELSQRKSAMPSGLDRLAKKIKVNDVDWRFELYNAINRHMRNNYSFMPPNKKHIHRGFFLPSLTSDTLSLSVAIDTSGSINNELLSAFMEEFKNI